MFSLRNKKHYLRIILKTEASYRYTEFESCILYLAANLNSPQTLGL